MVYETVTIFAKNHITFYDLTLEQFFFDRRTFNNSELEILGVACFRVNLALCIAERCLLQKCQHD